MKLPLLASVVVLIAVHANLYSQPKLPDEDRANAMLKKMTLEEKIDMIGGYNDFYIRPNERLGIPSIKMSDGPLGVRNYGEATAFPAGISNAASWNPEMVSKVGEAIGRECRAKGVHILLGPAMNIYRAPMCGRNFEYFGEDPYLAGRMAVGYVSGLQRQGVMATVKHYAGNNQEYDRTRISSDMDERTLQEIYLPAFRAAIVEGKAASVMTAYNLVNGTYCTNNAHLINDILKGQWKFEGFAMSDWSAAHEGVGSANAGLDLEMPSGLYMNRDTMLQALNAETVKLSTIDDKVRRMLRMMYRFGFFDRDQRDPSISMYPVESRAIALEASREGIVLLRNQKNLLPLNRSSIKSIAVIGPTAHPAVPGGGGSAMVVPFHGISILEGITAVAGNNIKIYYHQGVKMEDWHEMFDRAEFFVDDTARGKLREARGMRKEYFGNMNLSGTPVVTRIEQQQRGWGRSDAGDSRMPADSFSVRSTGKIRARNAGRYQFVVAGNSNYKLFIDGKMVIDGWKGEPALNNAEIDFKANSVHSIRVESRHPDRSSSLRLGYRVPDAKSIQEAKQLAGMADVAVVCLGFNQNIEGEGSDRPFELPNEQQVLLKEVSKAKKPVIAVISAGGNVKMVDWIDSTRALIHAWYPGQEGGTAVTEILFGDVNPSGKLPVSFEKRWQDNAVYKSYYDDDNDKHVKYSEGIFLGYRHFDKSKVEPLFPFGYGLSYTTFEYSGLAITPKTIQKGQKAVVSFQLKNTGKRDGAEIAQVYVRDMEASVPRPVKELKGFSKVFLKTGESKKVEITLGDESFAFYDTTSKSWKVEPGQFEILAGASSRDIKLKGILEIGK